MIPERRKPEHDHLFRVVRMYMVRPRRVDEWVGSRDIYGLVRATPYRLAGGIHDFYDVTHSRLHNLSKTNLGSVMSHVKVDICAMS
jgi:hypothetical protein